MPSLPSRTPVALKRRRTDQQMRGKPVKRVKKVRKQKEYHSSSEDEGADEPQTQSDAEAGAEKPQFIVTGSNALPVDDGSSEEQLAGDTEPESDDASESGSDDSLSDANSSTNPSGRNKKKRNDPDAFATSMQKILGSKLTTSKRADPILSRSKTALDAGKELAESRLDAKARHKLREDKRAQLEKGRVQDVLGLETVDISTQEIQEEERRLKKTAQRGVIKLFNAVRAAQVKGEQAAREAKKTGVVGIDKREEKVTEMSKKGFLDLIAGGGKKAATPMEA